MFINFFENNRVFKLDTKSTTYAFAISDDGYPIHLYYGAKINDDNLIYLSNGFNKTFSTIPGFQGDYRGFATNSFEYPTFGCGNMGESALEIKRNTGTSDTNYSFVNFKIYNGKNKIEGLPSLLADEKQAETLEVYFKDHTSGAEITLHYSVLYESDAITRHTTINNTSDEPLFIENAASLCLDFIDAERLENIHFYGEWAKERYLERVPFMHAAQTFGSRKGSSSAEQNPSLVVCDRETNENVGSAIGIQLIYAGSFMASCEKFIRGNGRVIIGINKEQFSWKLNPGEKFDTPEAMMIFTEKGFNDMSQKFHNLYRNHMPRSIWNEKKRPLLINNWEATYFGFTYKKLIELAKVAADVGIEMFVLDDGWFGKRNDDWTSLGDWSVNEEKMEGPMSRLIDEIKSLGLKFGIWMEPEMVSPKSELYEKHPDWVIQCKNRARSLKRHQYVLNLGRDDVSDYVFDCIDKTLSLGDITYLKWDFNRELTEIGDELLPADRQGEAMHRYVLGLYKVLFKVREKYPNLLLEGCSAGGGRYDPSLLYFCNQYWTSDNSDAISRTEIQYGTSFFYPPYTMGAHVSICPNHTTGRVTPLETRGNVALSGTFGYEYDLTTTSEEEKAVIREQCKDYHKYYNLTHNGDLFRLVSPFEDRDVAAWEFVSKDKSEALIVYVARRGNVNIRRFIYPKGLDPDALYENEMSGQVLSGEGFMKAGLIITENMRDYDSRIFHLIRK